MTTVYEAQRIILDAARVRPWVLCPIDQTLGRVLREDLRCDRDYPSKAKSAMDGIAVRFDDWHKGQRAFKITGVIAAGQAQKNVTGRDVCVRIMTGAIIPKGLDTVIPIEQVNIKEDQAIVAEHDLVQGQFVRRQASEAKKGELLMSNGMRLEAPHIGLAASIGKTKLKVNPLMRFAVIATGDELVDVGKAVKDHQTRLSNSYAVQAMLAQTGWATAERIHLPDQPKVLKRQIAQALKKYDGIILSGGVSKGMFDYIPDVLKSLNVKQLFHMVSQKPGKPFWFGLTKDKKPVFALPGNPQSTLICAYRYVIPYLAKSAGFVLKERRINVDEEVKQSSPLTQFILIKNRRLVHNSGSGDFSALTRADGFIEYDSKISSTLRPYFSWRI